MFQKCRLLLSVAIVLTLTACGGGGGAEDEGPVIDPLPPGVVEGYTRIEHEGFVIQVQDLGLTNYSIPTNEALEKVKADISAIVHDYDLAPNVLDSLRDFKFFIDWSKTLGGTARFHASANWLSNNDYIPEKLNSIEVSNVNNFLNFTQLNSPNILLHELAHLYHFTKLTVNFSPIYDNYVRARDSGIYDAVSYNVGNGNFVDGLPSPAVSDQTNYLAELTEAYFGTNDYFPFNREELRNHDPEGFALIELVWKD